MMEAINECPECGTRDTEKQMLDWMHDGVEIVYTCETCGLDFVASLRQPIKEVVHRYDAEVTGE